MKFVSLIMSVACLVFSITLETGIQAFEVEGIGTYMNRLAYFTAVKVDSLMEDVDLKFVKTYSNLGSVREDLSSGKIDVFFGLVPSDGKLIFSKKPIYALRYAVPSHCSSPDSPYFGDDIVEILKFLKEGKCPIFDTLVAKWLIENGKLRSFRSFGKFYVHVAFSPEVSNDVVEKFDEVISKMYIDDSFKDLIKSLGLENYAVPPDELVFANSEFPPYEYVEGGKWRGTDVEVLKRIFSKMGYEIHIEKMPWIRTLKMIRSRYIDGTFTIERTKERENYMIFVEEPINVGMDVIFYSKENPPDLSNPKSVNMGVVRGYAEESYVDSRGFEKVLVDDDESGLKMLSIGRIDAFITDYAVGIYYIRKMNLKGIVHTKPVRTYKLYIALSKLRAHEYLARELKEVLKDFKRSDEYSKILKEYGLRGGP